MKPVETGDDVVPVPPPVDEEPPHDRWCDLVLTGGVASGVVYPWAIVEIARAYRFRSIGGTSVGAMAAALAAAAEYGRRTGYEAPFEVLRRLPAALGESCDGRTRMLSLFQTADRGQRPIRLWAGLFKGRRVEAMQARTLREREHALKGRVHELNRQRELGPPVESAVIAVLRARQTVNEIESAIENAQRLRWRVILGQTIRVYWLPFVLGTFVTALGVWVLHPPSTPGGWLLWLLASLVGAPLGLAAVLASDIRWNAIHNNLGLCKGGTIERGIEGNDERPGLSEWLHKGIQSSAGLKEDDPPLTFRDLWTAPLYPSARPTACDENDPPDQRSIDLQVITTNVTHGRPYRLPLTDERARLFFLRADLEGYFPPAVLDALERAARPYAKLSGSDPQVGETNRHFLELPGADLPIVVAARLSLSFPLLFSAVPLHAIDRERKNGLKRIRRCLFSDGGVCSNFPIHLFDEALPRWPTFGLWLDSQGPFQREIGPLDEDDERVWLPDLHREGQADNWDRFDAKAQSDRGEVEPETVFRNLVNTPWSLLGGFLFGLLMSAKDWRDRTSFRLPHVRTRVMRLFLRSGEEGMHIGMPRAQILDMAHRYGTTAGRAFVERYCSDGRDERPAWREQRWVRLQLLLSSVRERLDGFASCVAHASHCVPIRKAIDEARHKPPPLRPSNSRTPEKTVTPAQAQSLQQLLTELEQLESVLRAAPPQDHYEPQPEPELRLRAPL